MKKNIIFGSLAVLILVAVGILLFGTNLLSASAANPANYATAQKAQAQDITDFTTDGILTAEDIVFTSPLPEHKNYLSVDQYAGYCKLLQSSSGYSKNIYTNAFLSMKRYVALEEVPIYDKFLKDAPGSSDPRTIVMNTIASNWKDHPELNAEGDMIMSIVAACK